MRKDYVQADQEAVSESEFLNRFWTDHWANVGWRPTNHRRLRFREEFRPFRKFLADRRGAEILDGGCGLGEWAVFLTDRGYRVTALDISPEAVRRLQEAYPQIPVATGDVRATGLPDAAFDAYYSWGVFEHFETDVSRCIAEAFRVLKPNGYLFVSVPHDNLRLAFRAAFERCAPAEPGPASQRFYQWRFTRGELVDLLTAGGFQVLEVRRIAARQGVLRFLARTIGLPYQWRLSRILALGASLVVPKSIFAHMILGVARKPATEGES